MAAAFAQFVIVNTAPDPLPTFDPAIPPASVALMTPGLEFVQPVIVFPETPAPK